MLGEEEARPPPSASESVSTEVEASVAMTPEVEAGVRSPEKDIEVNDAPVVGSDHGGDMPKGIGDALSLLRSYGGEGDSSSEDDVQVIGDSVPRPKFSKRQEESSSYDSDSSESSLIISDSEASWTQEEEGAVCLPVKVQKARGQVGVEELPAIEDLKISVPEDELVPLGVVYTIVDTLIVIESHENKPPLDLDSVLFKKTGEAIGHIFDVFGPVKRPYYSVRFNSKEEIDSKNLSVGTIIYCAPQTDYTQYVGTYQLMKQKGSDASWKFNNEPPPNQLDFSDDEQERMFKSHSKGKQTKGPTIEAIDVDAPPRKRTLRTFEERMNERNTFFNQLHSTPPVKVEKDRGWHNTVSRFHPISTGVASSVSHILGGASSYGGWSTPERVPNFIRPSIFSTPPPPHPFPFANSSAPTLPPPPFSSIRPRSWASSAPPSNANSERESPPGFTTLRFQIFGPPPSQHPASPQFTPGQLPQHRPVFKGRLTAHNFQGPPSFPPPPIFTPPPATLFNASAPPPGAFSSPPPPHLLSFPPPSFLNPTPNTFTFPSRTTLPPPPFPQQLGLRPVPKSNRPWNT